MSEIGIISILGVGGVACVVSALFWERFAWLRFLPILYFSVVGLVVSLLIWEHRDLVQILETVAVSGAIGTVCYFAVWVQRR
jgi:hypothetical protein